MERRGRLGKITQLAALLKHFHAAIESDLAGKGIDLLDLYRGRLSLRKVKVLIDHLPPGSAFWFAMTGCWWTVGDRIAADGVDWLSTISWQTGGGDQSKRPDPYPRPWVEKAQTDAVERNARAWRESKPKTRGGG